MGTKVGFNKEKGEAKESRFMKVELSNYTTPFFYQPTKKDWINWGKFNEYPYFLINLMNMHPEHGSIVRGKARYVFGKGLQSEQSDSILSQAKTLQFLDNANRYETWNDLLPKTCIQFQLYNGFAWQIIWNNGGTKFEVFNIEYGNLRMSACGKFVYYCDEWMTEEQGKVMPNQRPEKSSSFKKFDLFNPNIRTGTQIFIYRESSPEVVPYASLYPKPEYESAIMEIETDIEISKLHYWHMKNGMFASSMLTFFEGEPDQQKKTEIKKAFERTYGGTDNSGSVLFYFGDKGGTAPDLKTLTQSDLDKQFELVSKRNQEKIFSVHSCAPVLFGIKTEGSLSDTSGEATVKEWDKFVRTYIEYRQETLIKQIEYLANVQGVDADLYFEPTSPVGLDLPINSDTIEILGTETIKKYLIKKYNVEVAESQVQGQDSSMPLPVAQVNENLKKLSGKDWQHIKRLIREVNNGKTSKHVASLMLRQGYGLSDQDINILFSQNTNFSKFDIQRNEEDEILRLFEMNAIDDNDDEVLEESFVCHKFATESEIRNTILEALKGNPQISVEQLVKQFGLTTEQVTQVLDSLVTDGLVLNTGNAYEPTPKAIAKETPSLEVETYVVYKYALIDGIPDAKKSRPFCQRLMLLSKNGKRWTKEGIDNIYASVAQQMSMPEFDPWSYRGGFYTNPDTGETTAYCRHKWQSVTKSRRKK